MARRKRRKQKNSAALIAATVCLAVLSIGIVGAYGWLRVRAGSTPELDDASLCPVRGPTSETAILLDVTDPVSETTALDLKNEFQRIVASVPIGGAIKIYALTEKEGDLIETFSGCNPGDGGTVDEWTSNPRLVQARWEEGFQKPLDDIAKHLSEGESGNHSPIMAGIQKINLEAFGSAKASGIPKQLIIASDMIEHTDAFSNYRDGPSYKKFLQSPARDKFRTALNGVSVRFLAFQRPDVKFDMRELAEFWAEWVANNKGEFDGFVRLEGVL